MPPRPRAVFLDRDDTIIVNVPYLNDPAGVRLMPGAADALARLHRAGYLLVVVSNQSGIGRGLCSVEQVDAVNAEMCRQVAPVPFAAIYYSPDTPEVPSTTRKPATGLLLRARDELDIDLARSVLVGDKRSDVECGQAAGLATVWLSHDPAERPTPPADHTAASLPEAADWILTRA